MSEATLPTPPEALLKKLDEMGIKHVLHRHKAVFTCEESAFLKNEIKGVHVKNLFVKDKKDRMALVTLRDEINTDLKALAPAIGLDRLSFGSPERLWQYLGVLPGSVCPFAVINDTACKVRMVLDKTAAEADIMSAHPMLNTMSVSISGPDLVRFLETVGHPPLILDMNNFNKASAA